MGSSAREGLEYFFKRRCIKNIVPRKRCSKRKWHDRREPELFDNEIRCIEMICLHIKTYCCCDAKSDKHKFTSNELNKKTLEENRIISVTSTNREFLTINDCVAKYEKTARGWSYFYPKCIVQVNGF